MRENIILNQPKFNLELFKTFNFKLRVHSFQTQKVKYLYPHSEMSIFLSKQSKFATNSQIFFIFNFPSPDRSRDHN